MTSPVPPACLDCRRFHDVNEKGLICAAFPDGIPELVLLEGDPHTKPIPGDHGLRFEPRKGASLAQ